MPFSFAFKAVLDLTFITLELWQFIEGANGLAVRGWAPNQILNVVHCIIQGELLILFQMWLIDELFYILDIYIFLAVNIRAFDLELALVDLSVQVLLQALSVEDVIAAYKWEDVFLIVLIKAHLADKVRILLYLTLLDLTLFGKLLIFFLETLD